MDLESVLHMEPTTDGLAAVIPTGWDQGRTTFGGLVAAYLARAVETNHPRAIRSVDAYFLEPVPPGPIELQETGLREGKYVSHVEQTMTVAGKPVAVARFLLADPEPGPFDTVPMAARPTKTLDESIRMPFIDGVTPTFTQQFDIRIGEGSLPFSGSSQAVIGGFVRNKGAATGVAALLTHIDAWPPPVLALVQKAAAASTVRWHVQFHADVRAADGEQWSWLRNEATWRSGRLATVVGPLVREGHSVAYCEQTIAMYL